MLGIIHNIQSIIDTLYYALYSMLCIIHNIQCMINTLHFISYSMLCMIYDIQCIICRLFYLVMLSCIIDWVVLCRDYPCQDIMETITLHANSNNNNNFRII